MAISGQLNINIGLPNESTGSDSLYTAFNKIQDNFSNVFACASPYSNIIAGNGISLTDDSANGNITIDNAGVINIIPTSSINVSDDGLGNFQLSVTMDANGNIVGGVTSVGLQAASASRLSVTGGSPITSTGTWIIDLATSGATAGTYTYPTMTIDAYGRVTSISSGASVGTVTSVGLTPGSGIQITGGPVTTSGTITVTNTGVTSLTAGSGITLSGSNGAVTISSPSTGGTVTSVGVVSATLNVSGSPVVTSGTINIEIPTNLTIPGNLTVTTGAVINGGLILNAIPAINFIDSNGANSDTSIYYIDSGGTEALVVALNNNNKLEIYNGNVSIPSQLVVANGLVLQNLPAINFIDSNSTTTDTSIYYINSGGTEALVTVLNGSNKLEVYNSNVTIPVGLNVGGGLALTSTPAINFYDSNGTSVDTSIYYINSGGLEALVTALNGSNKLEVYNSNVTIPVGLNVGGGISLTSSPAINFYDANGTSTDTSIYYNNISDNLGIALNGSDKIEIFNGNITVRDDLVVDGSIILTPIPAGINFYDANGTSTDTSIYYNNVSDNLGIALNGSDKIEIFNNITSINTGFVVNKANTLVNGGSVNLSCYSTIFSTSGASTATMAAGTAGQIVTFMMSGASGAMVITVTNAGWGGAGTMTFNTTGQGCTLQYVSNKWYCVGNNGVTFA